MKPLAILFASMLFTACAAKVTAATDRMVIVRAAVPDMGVEKALVIADTECAKRGRAAVVQSVINPNSDKYIFNCVEK